MNEELNQYFSSQLNDKCLKNFFLCEKKTFHFKHLLFRLELKYCLNSLYKRKYFSH